MAYADLKLRNEQTKFNETPIEVLTVFLKLHRPLTHSLPPLLFEKIITDELMKAYTEISQLLTLSKLCNDKNPSIILKNCLRPLMQQIGVELSPEAVIEHKRHYYSSSKAELVQALETSKVVASEHRLFFQCIKKLMKFWGVISLKQSQKMLLQHKAPNKRLQIAIGTLTFTSVRDY